MRSYPMKQLYPVLLMLLLLLQLQAEKTAEKLEARPHYGVSDKQRWFKPAEKNAWESRIHSLLENANIEIILMILPAEQAAEIPMDVLLQQLSQRWGKNDCRGVIIHTPGKPDCPQVLMAGHSIEGSENTPAAIRQMVTNIEFYAHQQTTDQARLEAAFEGLSKQLTLFRERTNQREILEDQTNKKAFQNNSSHELREKMKILTCCMGIAFLLLVLAFGIYQWLKLREVIVFPKTSPRKRFCAPYSGGGGSSVSLHTRNHRTKGNPQTETPTT